MPFASINPTKGPSINDVSSEGEGGGPPSKPIYYISLYSNLSDKGREGGHKFVKMGRRRLWMSPYVNASFQLSHNFFYRVDCNVMCRLEQKTYIDIVPRL